MSLRHSGEAAGSDALVRPSSEEHALELRLLNAFELRCDGDAVDLPMSARRLVAFLALREHVLQRVYVACTLWIDMSEDRAYANLRSTLWRVNQPGHKVIDATASTLALAGNMRVDLREATKQARTLIEGSAEGDAPHLEASLTGELLPDWYDDWVLLEREHFRQLVLHALEARAERLAASGRFGEAADAALSAIASEPLRESAHRVLIRIHLAEGNASEAVRQYTLYRRLLLEQLGLEPSPHLQDLVRDLTPH